MTWSHYLPLRTGIGLNAHLQCFASNPVNRCPEREVVGVTQNWNEGFLGWVPTHKDQCPGVETILEVPGSLAESILR